MYHERNIKPVCAVSDCNATSYARGYCHPHYDQMRLYGETRQAKIYHKTCSFHGCGRKAVAKSLCNSHWAQQHRGRDLSPILTTLSADERFNRQYKVDEETGCWVWQKRGTGRQGLKGGRGGYPRFTMNNKMVAAHRYSYEKQFNVVLSSEDTLDHLCRNTLCVNPFHLEKVSLSENVSRKNLYYALRSENERLKKFISMLGVDPNVVLSVIH